MSTRALEFAAALRDDLSKQLPTSLAIGQLSAASDGSPTLMIGTGIAGSESAFIKVKDEASLFKTGLGLTARGFGNPLRVQISLEASATANSQELNLANLVPLLSSIALRGAVIDVYLTADGTAVGVGGDINGTLTSTWYPDMKWKLPASM